MQFTPASHITQHWQLTKPAASGRRGMVVSQAKSAAEAGVPALHAGGTAIGPGRGGGGDVGPRRVGGAFALRRGARWNAGRGGMGHAVIHRPGGPRAETV